VVNILAVLITRSMWKKYTLLVKSSTGGWLIEGKLDCHIKRGKAKGINDHT
jgi:hypothetical protein